MKEDICVGSMVGSRGKSGRGGYLIYTLIFGITAFFVFCWFLIYGKALLQGGDGLLQHYNSLAYFGKYLREIVTTLFQEGRLEIPMWDFKIGLGADVLATLNYYVLGDPLNLLSVFVPASRTEILYEALIVLRLYLAGLGFIMYCKMMKREGWASVCGAIAYVFCGYFFIAVRHPFFINPMVYLPLLFMGIEKIFAGKKPYLFIMMTALSAISNFYFFYMLSVMIFLYALLRFFFLYKERRVYHFFICLRNFCGYYLIGLLMACVLFLPNLYLLFSSGRINLQSEIPLFYSIDYYKDLFFGLLSGKSPGAWAGVSFSPIVIPAIMLLYMKRKKHTELKIAFVMMILFLIFPFCGYVMNGFSYVSNRWTFVFGFLGAFILATMLPDMLRLKRKEIGYLIGATVFYLVMNRLFKINVRVFLVAWGVMAAAITGVCLYSLLKRSGKRAQYGMYVFLIIATSVGAVWQGFLKFNMETGSLDTYVDRGTAYGKLTATAPAEIKKLSDSEFYRYDLIGLGERMTLLNSSLLSEVNGTDFYFSLADGSVGDYLLDNSVRSYLTYKFNGLDNRSSLETLANIKYQVAGKTEQNMLYGYEPVTDLPGANPALQVYENKYALPFGYTYLKVFPKEKYKRLNPVQKQEVMLQAAVLDSGEEEMDTKDVRTTGKEIKASIKCHKGVTFDGTEFHVKRGFARATIRFEGAADSETYLWMNGMKYLEEEKGRGEIWIKTECINKRISVMTPFYRAYEGKELFLTNLGYQKQPQKKVELIFESKGRFKISELKILCQPMRLYGTQVGRLREDVLTDTTFTPNRITGEISLDRKKLLCMSIPYSRGWKAYVDGKKASLIKTNVMYSGLILDPGEHTVELKYFSPGLKLGLLCSLAGLISLSSVVLFHKKRSRRF